VVLWGGQLAGLLSVNGGRHQGRSPKIKLCVSEYELLNVMGDTMRTTMQTGLAIMAIGIIWTTTAQAVLVSYTDRAAFEAAAGVVQIETFDAFVPPVSVNPRDFGPFTTRQVDPLINVPALVLQAGSHAANVNGTNFIQYRTQQNSSTPQVKAFDVLFDQGIRAFGFDWRNSDTNDAHMEFGFGPNVFDLGSQGIGFFGVISTSNLIGHIEPFFFGDRVGDGSLVFGAVDNLTYVVPEPGSLALLAGGGLISFRRRRPQSDAPGDESERITNTFTFRFPTGS